MNNESSTSRETRASSSSSAKEQLILITSVYDLHCLLLQVSSCNTTESRKSVRFFFCSLGQHWDVGGHTVGASNPLIDCIPLHRIDDSSSFVGQRSLAGWETVASLTSAVCMPPQVVRVTWKVSPTPGLIVSGMECLHPREGPLNLLLSNLPEGKVQNGHHVCILLFFLQGSLLSFCPFQSCHLLSLLRSSYRTGSKMGLSLSFLLLAVSEKEGSHLFGLRASCQTEREQ